MSHEEKKHHEYDGIIELDNPMPTWWLWTFFLTIIFSFLYYIHYELAGGPTLTEELKVSMERLERSKSLTQSSAPIETEGSLQALFADADLGLGQAQYEGKCAACHGPQLQGLIGPNLTDNYWLHGGSHMDLVKVIREGVPEKGMPPWGAIMKRDEIYAVGAYILSKKGSQPAGARPPEGDLFE